MTAACRTATSTVPSQAPSGPEISETQPVRRQQYKIDHGNQPSSQSHVGRGNWLPPPCSAVVALAQSPRPGESSLELEPSLFVQLPGSKSNPRCRPTGLDSGATRKILPRENPRAMRLHGFLHSHSLHVPEPGRGSGALAYPPDMRPRHCGVEPRTLRPSWSV